MTYYGRGNIEYNLESKPFKSGGESDNYDVIGHPELLAKIYKAGKNTREKELKLTVMLNNPPTKSALSQIAWPLDVLYDNGLFVGFVMQKAQNNEDLNVIYEYGSAAKYPHMTWGNKITIARNLCVVLDAIHEAGFVVGDFNPRNVNVDPSTGKVFFIDTDSYHIIDGDAVYRCNVCMPEYVPIEIQEKLRNANSAGIYEPLSQLPLPTFTKESDNFALAVHIFQLLMNGIHPYACAILPSKSSVAFQPQPSDNIANGQCPFFQYVSGITIPRFAPDVGILPTFIQVLFNRAFVAGNAEPEIRPNAREWYDALGKIGNLTKCEKVSYHEYASHLSNCPWCAIEARFARNSSDSIAQSTFNSQPVPIKAPTPPQKTTPLTGNPAPLSKTIRHIKKKGGFRRKVRVSLIVILLVFLGYIAYNISLIKKTNTIIFNLPESAPEYSIYFDEIQEATTSYNRILSILRRFVSNHDKLVVITQKYNEEIELKEQIRIQEENEKEQIRIQEENAARVAEVEELISLVPEGINDYHKYERQIVQAYNAYNKLQDELKEKVFDKDRIINEYQAYNLAIVTEIRKLIEDVSLKTVEGTKGDNLAEIARLYRSLSEEQHKLLTAKEETHINHYLTIESLITFYSNLENNVVSYFNYYDHHYSDYSNLPNNLKPLVYNYIEYDEVKSRYTLALALEYKDGALYVKSEYRDSLSGKVVVPEHINGVTVRAIASEAFLNCYNITSLVIPDSVKEIGSMAFAGCISLRELTIPFVGNKANSSGKYGHFGYIFGDYKYNNSGTTKVQQYYDSTIYSYYIPSLLTTLNITNAQIISDYAFQNCSMLENINMNPEIMSVGVSAFSGCSNLRSIDLPQVRIIKSSAFANCNSLETFYINKDLTTIPSECFANCNSLKRINSNTDGVFIIPDSVKEIGSMAFAGCISLRELTIPFVGNKANSSGKYGHFGYIFGDYKYNNSGTTKVQQYYDSTIYSYYIPSLLTTLNITNAQIISDYAFQNCSMLKSMTINNSVNRKFGTKAFENCVSPKFI